MSTPYHYSPRIPAPPHSTPLSVSAYGLTNGKPGRVPIHNPYDKFTQPEFDAWIGGITGALRRALGQEEEEAKAKEQEKRAEIPLGDSYSQYDQLENYDEPLDDSFAEIKARRAIGKGKARDPREGPGLGKGDSTQPIEIVSSDEEDAQEVELSMVVQDEGSDDEEEEEEDYDEEGEYSWDRGQSSSQPLPSPRTVRRKQVVREEESDDGEGEYDEEGEYEEFDEEEYDEEDGDDYRARPVRVASDDVIEIISDDEEEEALLPQKPREAEEVEEVSDDYEEYSEDEDEQLGTAHFIYADHDLIRRPRDDVDEDEEEGDVPGYDDEIEEVQPIDADISFPPKTKTLSPSESKRHIELPDPWSGPRTYAEDFYSGGDLRVPPGTKVDINHLGPMDVEDLDAEEEQVEGSDVIQPMDEDTSFPVLPEEHESGIEIPDTWEGPKTYAEDFYSGGDVSLPPGKQANPHYIGATDVDYAEELDTGVVEQVDDSDKAQPLSEDTSFLHQDEEREPPVELADPWDGPQTYAEDFYSGGDVCTLPGHQIDPALLSGTANVDDDIDSFLTPGALTPNLSEEHTSMADDVYEEEEQVIQPPTNHFVSPALRRNQPIPEDAEVINIDDSDEEQEQENEEVPIRIEEPGDFEADGDLEEDDGLEEGSDEEDNIFEEDEDMVLMYPEPEELHHEEGIMAEEVQEVQERELEEVDELIDDDDVVPTAASVVIEDVEVSTSDLPVQTVEDVHDEVLVMDEDHPSEPELPVVSDELENQKEETSAVGHSPSVPISGPNVPEVAEDINVLDVDTSIEDIQQQDVNGDVLLPAEVVEPDTASEYTEEEEPSLEVVIDSAVQAEAPIEDIGAEHDTTTVIVEEDVADESKVDLRMGREESAAAEEVVPIVEEAVEIESQDITCFSEGVIDVELQGPITLAVAENDVSGAAVDLKTDAEEVAPDVIDNEPELKNDILSSHFEEEAAEQTTPAHPVASTSTAPSQPPTHGQLPTPPSEKGRYVPLPLVVEGGEALTAQSPRMKHKVEIEEVTDEDADIPQPTFADTAVVEIEMDAFNPKALGYSVEEVDEYLGMVAEGEDEGVDHHDDISMISVASSSDMLHRWHEEKEGYSKFEEPMTEGKLTEEPTEREMSLGVVSVSPEEAAAFHEHERDLDAEDNSLPAETATQLPSAQEKISPAEETLIVKEETTATLGTDEIAESTQETEISVSVTDTDAAHTDRGVPMPITADANVPDPVDRPRESPSPEPILPIEMPVTPGLTHNPILTPQLPEEQASASVSVPSSSTALNQPSQQDQNPPQGVSGSSTQADGLFTPAESSTNAASVEQPEDVHSRILTSLAQALFGPGSSPAFFGGQTAPFGVPSITSTPNESLAPAPQSFLPDVPTPLRVGPGNTIEEDVFGDVQSRTNTATNRAKAPPIPTSLPYRTPSSLSMGVKLRKPTIPILMADPFPYSLSTPGSVYAGHEEASEDDTGLDNSMSSNSTLEKVAEDKDTAADADGLEFQYPPAEFGGNVALPLLPAQVKVTVADASGSTKNIMTPSIAQEVKETTPTSSRVANGGEDQLETQTASNSSKRKREPSPEPSQKPEFRAKLQRGKGRKSSKSERRKSQASKDVIPEPISDETIVVKPRPRGKIIEPVKRAPSEVSQGSQTSSGASAAYMMLQPKSRASSIASSAPSSKSFVTQPSPTVNKPNVLPPQPPAPQVSLLHAHGQKRKALAQTLSQPMFQYIQPRKPQLSYLPSLSHGPQQPSVSRPSAAPAVPLPSAVTPPIAAVKSPILPAAKPTPSPSRQMSMPSLTSSPATGTPVTRSTRSHCRYHRISLPKEEGGPRVRFLVPGCSLNDKELIEEEEIEDHGDATQEDSQRMISDIESLGFSLELIGILRQLVGLDILREGEVFYLPQPGEEVTVQRKIFPRKSTLSERSGIVRTPGESSSHGGSPGYSGSVRSPGSNRAPLSVADSTSTSLSALRKVVDSEKGSTVASTDSEPDPSDDDEPNAKRARQSFPGEQGVMGPPSHSKGKRLKPKRGKIDLTYQPEEEPEEASDVEQSSRSKRRKSAATRGVKRMRPSDAAIPGEEGGERDPKKYKPHLTAPEPTTTQQSAT